MDRPAPRCSFCGKKQGEVRLVAGPSDVYICNLCIGLSNEILAQEDDPRGLSTPGPRDPRGLSTPGPRDPEQPQPPGKPGQWSGRLIKTEVTSG